MSPDPYDEHVETKAWDSALFARLLEYARPHSRLFAGSFAILICVFLIELTGPRLIRAAVDGPIADAEAASRVVDVGGDWDASSFVATLGWIALAYFGLVALGTWLRYLEVSHLGRTGQAVVHDVRTRLFGHMQRQDLAWFDKRPTGALVTRVTNDVENLNELFTSGVVQLLFDSLKVVVVLCILLWKNAEMGLVVLSMTPVLIAVSILFRGGARRAHRRVRARLARLNAYLQEVLSGVRVVQAFGRAQRVSARFHDLLAEYFRANLRTIFLFALFFPVIAFFSSAIQGGIVWRGGSWIVDGELTLGEFLEFWMYVGLMLGPIQQLGERYNVMQAAFASAERIFEILDSEPRVERAGAPTRAPEAFRGHVRFDGVSFAYLGSGREAKVLQDVSFEIAPGETVALVGATGSGKSTIVSLLLRFYDATAGAITIDGIDVRELDLAAWRPTLGLVMQDDFLFTGSVRENLELGRDGMTEERIGAALEASAAGDVVARLPLGLETEVAERGATLSTGERELLAIARALAGDPRLVILDEATSSVDSATEARIEEATHALLRGRSALVVAHRLSTVRRADRICVLHKGRLRESGTHRELLAAGGLYARLYAMQFRDDDEVPA